MTERAALLNKYIDYLLTKKKNRLRELEDKNTLGDDDMESETDGEANLSSLESLIEDDEFFPVGDSDGQESSLIDPKTKLLSDINGFPFMPKGLREEIMRRESLGEKIDSEVDAMTSSVIPPLLKSTDEENDKKETNQQKHTRDLDRYIDLYILNADNEEEDTDIVFEEGFEEVLMSRGELIQKILLLISTGSIQELIDEEDDNTKIPKMFLLGLGAATVAYALFHIHSKLTEFIFGDSQIETTHYHDGAVGFPSTQFLGQGDVSLVQFVLDDLEPVVTSPFGTTAARVDHSGTDFRAREPKPLYAPFDGRVIGVVQDAKSTGGLQIIITDNNNTIRLGFAHLSKMHLSVGDTFKKGYLFAHTGATGRSAAGKRYAPHLHMTYRAPTESGEWELRDPMQLMNIPVTPPKDESEYLGSFSKLPDLQLDNLGESINNPFSLKRTGDVWDGESGTYVTPGGLKFVTFADPYFGIRAGMKTIHTQADPARGDDAVNTISKFVDRFVTTADNNDTRHYKKFLSDAIGKGINENIDLREKETLIRFSQAVAQKESGSRIPTEYLSRVYEENIAEQSSSAQVFVAPTKSSYNKKQTELTSQNTK